MAVKVLDNGWISDDFEIGINPFVLKDSLVMLSEQYAALTPTEIAAIKQQRYDEWYAIVTAPLPVTPDPQIPVEGLDPGSLPPQE